MDQYKADGKMDPDYESYNAALVITKEEDKKENTAKLKRIIEEEFDKELTLREEQIGHIELQISKVRKLLHLLRYALVSSYYKKKELEFSASNEEAPSTSENSAMPSQQSRIHPAVKKLLGNNLQSLELQYLNLQENKRSRILKNPTMINNSLKRPNTSPSQSDSKKSRLELEETETTATSCDKIDHKEESLQVCLESIKKRKKTKYRIIVGNISKFIPSSEYDNLTHKWMVYVRGPKEKPDVSDLIEKVVFYLHPSYKPYDVVSVDESPFHLSRRGWGEFPVRVQIFFKVKINKPIDIVHNIKLDRTYTGRQTLGNETLLDVFLYENSDYIAADNEDTSQETKISTLIPVKQESPILFGNQEIKEEIKEEILDDISVTDADDGVSNDHSYSLSFYNSRTVSPKKHEKIMQDESNELIYGLENYLSQTPKIYNKSKLHDGQKQGKSMVSISDFNKLFQLNRKDIKFNNTKIIVFGKKIDGLLTNISKIVPISKNAKNLVLFASKKEQNDFKISLPKNKFKNMGEVLPYLFKRLPLCSELANNLLYKRLYPFTAATQKEYASWNIGKRRSAEWSRARSIKELVQLEVIFGADKWNTKAIYMYGRSHCYTPFPSFGLFNRLSSERNLLLSVFSNSDPTFRKFNINTISGEDSDFTINVDSDTEPTTPRKKYKSSVDVSDSTFSNECSFIKHTALDVGIMLRPEEIEDGVVFNGAERTILEAVKLLANNLIRRAQNYRVCQKLCSGEDDVISREDVQVAIDERPELRALLNFKQTRRNMEYFF